MNQLFGNEGLLQTVFGKIWDLLVLNLCFLLSCLPVFTIGAAWTALFSVNLKAVRREEGSVFRDYWNAFRENFPQGTKLWALTVLIGAVFAADFWALGMLEGTVVWVLRALLGALLVVYLTVLPWVFGYNARFADNVRVVLKNSLLLAGSNMAVSLAMLCCGFLGQGARRWYWCRRRRSDSPPRQTASLSGWSYHHRHNIRCRPWHSYGRS